jgi:hypothetical protein
VEPAHDLPLETWWRGVDARMAPTPPNDELPREMPWPID